MSKRPPVSASRAAFLPRVRWVPKPYRLTDAEDAIFLASSYGLVPDEWQCDIVRAWMGRRRDGKWCAGRCGLAVPRQNGKNGAIEVRELFGMVVLGEAILHTAHEVKTARKAFKRLKHFFGEQRNDPTARYPELNALVKEVRNTNGQEAIYLHDVCVRCNLMVGACGCEVPEFRRGGSIEFVARSKGSGRGFTVDLLILDEAQALSDEELEAIRSAVSSAPLGNAQVIYTGTPPDREKGQDGTVWVRIRSGANKDKRLCWIEYGAEDGPLPDLEDMDLLFACNPALELRHANGAYGLRMDVVTDERGDLSPEGYARERLGWWGNPNQSRRGVVDMAVWGGLRSDAPAPTEGLVVVDVSPDLEWTSIGVAAAGPGGRTLVLVDRLEGTTTAAAAVKALVDNLDDVLEVALTPTAKVLAGRLVKLKVNHVVLTNSDVGAGCVAFQTMVRGGSVTHVGQQVLDDAVRNAGTRYVGDVQHWDRKNRDIDISALVATSTAGQRFAATKPKTPPPTPRPVRTTSRSVAAGIGF